jgi:uncharacterized protein DUF4118
MKTFLANLAAKPSSEGHLNTFKHWLYLRGEVLRYVLAPVAVAIAFLARLALTPIVGDASPYLFFVPAVLAAGGVGGLGPGLLATALSVVLGYFVTISPGVSVAEIVDAALFAMIGIGISWERTAAAAQPDSGHDQHARGACARGPSRIDPRDRPRRDDRDRCGRDRAIVQFGRRAAVRLYRA